MILRPPRSPLPDTLFPHPTLFRSRIVGDEIFRAMARVYVASAPPHSPIMLDYGASFPDFIERFEPATTLPYLADVARIERAWIEAYHAAERSEEHTSELQSLMRNSYAVFCLKKHKTRTNSQE